MSITRDYGEVIFECDGCGDVEDTGTRDFGEAVQHIKDKGWIIRKKGGERMHYCSRECAS